MGEAGVSGQMHGEVGTTTCSSAEGGDKDGALVAFKISLHPPGSSSASGRYFGSGGGGLAGSGSTWAPDLWLGPADILMPCITIQGFGVRCAE